MVLAEDAGAVGEDLFVQGDGLGDASSLSVRPCEVVARDKGVGVVLAEDAGAVGEDLLEQGDGLGDASSR